MVDASIDYELLDKDAEDEGQDHRALALQISDDLHDDDIEGLKFFSRDFVPGAKLERMKNVEELFTLWEKQNKFGKKNITFFAECLSMIQRLDLLEELGLDEDDIQEKIDQGLSQITEYRKTLYNIAEDLDSEELQKMLYLIGDLKKKDRQKIKTTLNLFVYFEQTKQISPNNMTKLEEILRTIDRNDLVDIIESYKGKQGHGGEARAEERMDTSEYSHPQPQTAANPNKQKPVHRTIAEKPPADPPPSTQAPGRQAPAAQAPAAQAPAAQAPARQAPARQAPARQLSGATVERQVPLQVGCETTSMGVRVEQAPEAAVMSLKGSPEPVFQDVIVEPVLKDMSDQLGREVDDNTWLVFGFKLKLTVDILQKVSRQYPQMRDRMFHMLTFWLHSWRGGFDGAIAEIISALHEVQIHHLAEQFSKIYKPQGMSETTDPSLRSGSIQTLDNISVNTNEARYDPTMHAVSNQTEEIPTASPSVRVLPTNAVEDNILPVYKMEHFPRGICIIISNETFYKNPEDTRARQMPNREGTRVDADNLMKTFRDLYFEVRLHENLKGTDMVRLMVQTALNVDHANYDCFVCCILSHGTTGHIYGADGNLVNISDLTGPLKTVVCPSLAGKPKLFFIQACQGREKQPGHEIESDGAVPEVEIDGLPREVIPNEADFLMGYATVPGFVSYRSRTHGSWYVTKLCEMLNKYGRRYDLLSVLLLVNNEVGRANAMMDGGRYKQSPAPLYTLRKKLIFT